MDIMDMDMNMDMESRA